MEKTGLSYWAILMIAGCLLGWYGCRVQNKFSCCCYRGLWDVQWDALLYHKEYVGRRMGARRVCNGRLVSISWFLLSRYQYDILCKVIVGPHNYSPSVFYIPSLICFCIFCRGDVEVVPASGPMVLRNRTLVILFQTSYTVFKNFFAAGYVGANSSSCKMCPDREAWKKHSLPAKCARIKWCFLW